MGARCTVVPKSWWWRYYLCRLARRSKRWRRQWLGYLLFCLYWRWWVLVSQREGERWLRWWQERTLHGAYSGQLVVCGVERLPSLWWHWYLFCKVNWWRTDLDGTQHTGWWRCLRWASSTLYLCWWRGDIIRGLRTSDEPLWCVSPLSSTIHRLRWNMV